MKPEPKEDVALTCVESIKTTGQRALIAARRVNLHRGQGAQTARQRASNNGVTVAVAAAKAGLAKSTVSNAKFLLNRASPEIIAAVDAGTLTMTAAANIVNSGPKAMQSIALERVLKAIRPGKKQASAKALGILPPPRPRKLDPDEVQILRCLHGIDIRLEVLQDRWSNVDQTRWTQRLAAIRRAITYLIRGDSS